MAKHNPRQSPNRRSGAPKAERPASEPGTVSLSAAARRWKIGKATISRWRTKGLLVLGDDGRIDVAGSERLLIGAGKLPGGADDQAPDPVADRLAARLASGEMLTTAEADQVKQNYLARLRQLQYDREAARVVAVEDVAQVITNEYALVRNRLLAMPNQTAPRIAARTGGDAAVIAELLRDAVAEALEHLTQDGGDGGSA